MLEDRPSDAAWGEFARSRDPELWERLAPEFERLAQTITVLLARSGQERKRLFEVALVSLVGALDRYPASGDLSFPDFAIPVVIRELRRYRRGSRTAFSLAPRRTGERRAASLKGPTGAASRPGASNAALPSDPIPQLRNR